MAIGLEVLSPTKTSPAKTSTAPVLGNTTAEVPQVALAIEGSLRHLEGSVDFKYSAPGISNPAAEAEALAELMRIGFESDKGKAVLRGEDAVVGFFANELPRLKQKWTVTEGERFQHVTRDIVRFEPQFALRERGDGWLDFHVHFSAGKEAVLSDQDVRRLLQSGTPQLKLASGRIAVPDSALAADLEEVLRDCNPTQERGVYRIPPAQRGYVEASIASWSQRETDAAKSPPKKLGPLESRLRPYQIEGASWLLEHQAGLLADDMGLGKTIQALAYFEATPGPHLVVCPSSLVWNWTREAARFVPGLQVLALSGSDREKLFDKIPEHDLIVTSYALLRRDVDHYQN
ncbi:MAG: SNF2-related protein, partial [Spartobacteria bacterium]